MQMQIQEHQIFILTQDHGLFNNIDTKAKCRHLKKLTCKGTLRQVFIRVYRLEIHLDMLVFSTELCELLPLQFLSASNPPPLPCVNKYTVRYSVQGGGGIWGLGPQTDKHLPQSPFKDQLFQTTTFCFGVYIANQSMPRTYQVKQNGFKIFVRLRL